jgi:hypothetical protein
MMMFMLKMEAVNTSKMFVNFYETRQHNITEDYHLQNESNFKSGYGIKYATERKSDFTC